jgi:anthranilate 1,2-dioxygenase small subunit
MNQTMTKPAAIQAKPTMPALAAATDAELDFMLRTLNESYAACLDDSDLERWPGYFVDDARYRITSRENHVQGLPLSEIYCVGVGMMRDRATAIRQTTVFEVRPLRHLLGGPRVQSREGGRVGVVTNFTIVEAPSDAEPRILMVGRYLDTVVEHDGALRFAERVCVYDNYRINTTLLFPV